MTQCVYCGTALSAGAMFCTACGKAAGPRTCAHCGAEISESAAFCGACGYRIAANGSTVQTVFDIAIHLIDAQNESTGSTETADTKEYQLRTPDLLNSILDRVYTGSDTFMASPPGRRPICKKIRNMDDVLDLDERICQGVLPYGLAGLLLSEENPTLANFFWQTFLEQLAEAKSGIPADIGGIEDVYGGFGGIEHGRFSQW